MSPDELKAIRERLEDVRREEAAFASEYTADVSALIAEVDRLREGVRVALDRVEEVPITLSGADAERAAFVLRPTERARETLAALLRSPPPASTEGRGPTR